MIYDDLRQEFEERSFNISVLGDGKSLLCDAGSETGSVGCSTSSWDLRDVACATPPWGVERLT